jgi:hypothetical protein
MITNVSVLIFNFPFYSQEYLLHVYSHPVQLVAHILFLFI